MDILLAHVRGVEGRIKAAQGAMDVGNASCGVGPSDGIALLGVADLVKVDVILESGTAGGVSTELMARFFEGTGMQITTVDFGREDIGGRCSLKAASTHQRLAPFRHVKALIGDSNHLFPELILNNRGKRVGLFIDGPKGFPAVKLCMAMLRSSSDVMFCVFHDVLPPETGRRTEIEVHDYLLKWGRTVAMTCCSDKWLTHFGLRYGRQSSMGIVAGTGLVPLGVAGDF